MQLLDIYLRLNGRPFRDAESDLRRGFPFANVDEVIDDVMRLSGTR